MAQPMPYYLAYPVWEQEETAREMSRDYDYLQSLYPKLAKQILTFVEERLDLLDYGGSMIYDAYPDRVWLKSLCREIEKKLPLPAGMKRETLSELVEIILYHALLKRRQMKRN